MKKPAVPVYVIPRKNSKYLYLRCYHPETGNAIERSSKCTSQKEALKAAARWEAEISSGKYKFKTPHSLWEELKERYIDEAVSTMKQFSSAKCMGVIAAFEECLNPTGAEFTASDISKWQAWLRSRKFGRSEESMAATSRTLSEQTVKSHTSHIRAMLRWGYEVGIVQKVPLFPRSRKSATTGSVFMKGRPITEAEYQLMLSAAIDPEVKRYIEGLWLSGMRLMESLDLWWDRPDRMCIIESHGQLLMKVSGEIEKGGRDRVMPLTPDFQEFLNRTPTAERKGRVFFQSWKVTPPKDAIAKRVTQAGKVAGIVVSQSPLKYASAHDLRRSFGTRWAMRVKPMILKHLMRHSTIQTTERYYVDFDAIEIANLLVTASCESRPTKDPLEQAIESQVRIAEGFVK